MKLIAVLVVSVALTACSKGQALDCAALDRDLVVCPSPKPPHVAELTGGKVVVELTIRLDGSVSDARIVASSGNSAWEESILSAVNRWRFRQSDHVVTKTVPFDVQIGQ